MVKRIDHVILDSFGISFILTNSWKSLARISNDIHYKLLNDITYPLLNFNGCTVDV